jgi:isocitrate lyase
MFRSHDIDLLEESWQYDKRWQGIERPYTAEEVVRLRGSVQIEYTLARMGAERLWRLLHDEPYVNTLGASPATRRCRWSRPVSKRFT